MHLHIVCLDNPFPPNYGGAIDMYYKIIALTRAGFKPVLHIFHKGDRTEIAPILRQTVEAIFFYKRNHYIHYLYGRVPYFIRSRPTKILAQKIRSLPGPVLIEGVHCGNLLSEKLPDYPLILRAHNYETSYYFELALNEDNWFRKYYYMNEAQKLKLFEPQIWLKAHGVAAISKEEVYRIEETQPNVKWCPAFISEYPESQKLTICQDPILLFHANFGIKENQMAGEWLLQVILPRLTPAYELWLAGSEIPKHWKDTTRVKIIKDPENMAGVIRQAGVIVLPIRQRSGVKLKYLESVNYNLRVVCTGETIVGTGLERDAIIFEGIRDTVEKIEKTFRGEYDTSFLNLQTTFRKFYNNDKNASTLKSMLEGSTN